MYKYVVKPLLFLLSPDMAHRLVVGCGRLVQALPPVRWLLRRWWGVDSDILVQEIDGREFTNPIGLAAGFDKNAQLSALMESVGFGFATGGSVTLEPRAGNLRPWFRRLPKTQSVVVFAGMPNQGLSRIRQYMQRNQRRLEGMPTVLSVAVVANKTTRDRLGPKLTQQAIIDDVKKTTEYITQHQLSDVVEINISCPNAGREPFIHPEALEPLLAALDTVPRDVPYWVKLPHLYDMQQFDALLRVIVKHNVQGVTVANLVKDRSRVNIQDPLPDEIPGGLSGLPTQQQSVALIRHAYQQYGDRLTIIGVGGVFSPEDAYQKIRAGASLIGVVTGLFFEGPQLVKRLNVGLLELLKRDGFNHISDAVGADCRESSKKLKNLSKNSCKTKPTAV